MGNLLILILLVIFFGWVFGLLFLILPAILPIIIVYNLTKNWEEKERIYINILSIAFFIPFIAFCLYSIALNILDVERTALFLVLDLMFIMLPMSFVITAFIPSRKFKNKKFALLTIILTAIISFIFISLAPSVDATVTKNGLQEYQSVITYIEQYKNKNNNYPEKLDKKIVSSKIYKYYNYTTQNNRKDYKLEVGYTNYSGPSYIYCSSEKLDECSEDFKSIDYAYIKTGKWIKKVFSD